MRQYLMTIVGLVLLNTILCAQDEAVEIKVGKSKVGESARITKVYLDNSMVLIDVAEEKERKQDTFEAKYVYVQTILDKPDPNKKETKAKRVYEVAEKLVDGEATRLSFDKKTVLIEKKNGKYTFAVDGVPLPKEEASILEEEYADEDDTSGILHKVVLPGRPVKIGESWKIDLSGLMEKNGKESPFKVDREKAMNTARLIKVYTMEGHRFGVIEVNAFLPLLDMKYGEARHPLKGGSDFTVTGQIDLCIDGSLPWCSNSVNMRVNAGAAIPVNKINVSMHRREGRVFKIENAEVSGTVRGEQLEIKMAEMKVGQSARVTNSHAVMRDLKAKIGSDEKRMLDVGDEKFVYIEKILEGAGAVRKATKLTRTYETAEVVIGGNTKKLPLENKTVTIEKAGDSYKFSIDGKPLPPDMLDMFEREFSKESSGRINSLPLPSQPVRIGEEWKIDESRYFETQYVKTEGRDGFLFSSKNAQHTAKLMKVYTMDGHRYGVIQYTSEMPITSLMLSKGKTYRNRSPF